MKYLKKFFDFFPTPRFLKFSSVGIDISNNSLHYAELISDGKSAHLGRFGQEVFEKGDNMLDNQSLKEALMRLKKQKKISFVKAALPEEETYLYTMETAGDTDADIRSDIEFHLEENVPLSGSDVLFDFYHAPREKGKKTIVVSVVPKETVDRYITLFTSCGIFPASFIVESGALSRSIIKRGTPDTYLLVYLSHDKSVIAVAVRGFVEFSSTSSFGGGIFNSAIQKELNVTEQEASKIKYSRGLVKPDEKGETLADSLANSMSVLRDEIQKVILYWHKHPSSPPIKKVLICGKDASVPGLSDYLAVSLRMPVEVGNIWTNIEHYSKIVPPIPFEDSLSYGTALGLVISN